MFNGLSFKFLSWSLPKAKLLLSIFWFTASITLASPHARAMEFVVLKNEQRQDVLMMYGPILADDNLKLRRALNSNPQLAGYWLSSGGGLLSEARLMAQQIRDEGKPIAVPSISRIASSLERTNLEQRVQRDLALQVDQIQQGMGINYCASACSAVLAGGVTRYVDEPFSVGIQSSYYTRESIRRLSELMTSNELYDFLQIQFQVSGVENARFLARMGLNTKYAELQALVPSRCMYWLSAHQMVEFGVANVESRQPSGDQLTGNCLCSGGEKCEAAKSHAEKMLQSAN